MKIERMNKGSWGKVRAFFDIRTAKISNLGVYYPFNEHVRDIVGGYNLTLTGGSSPVPAIFPRPTL